MSDDILRRTTRSRTRPRVAERRRPGLPAPAVDAGVDGAHHAAVGVGAGGPRRTARPAAGAARPAPRRVAPGPVAAARARRVPGHPPARGRHLLEDVRAQAERMVQRTEIVRQANQVAQRILDDAREEARRLRHEAEDYCDQKLASFEIVLDRTIKTVQAGREKLQVTPPPLPEDSDAPGVGADGPPTWRRDEPGSSTRTTAEGMAPARPFVVHVAKLRRPPGTRWHERASGCHRRSGLLGQRRARGSRRRWPTSSLEAVARRRRGHRHGARPRGPGSAGAAWRPASGVAALQVRELYTERRRRRGDLSPRRRRGRSRAPRARRRAARAPACPAVPSRLPRPVSHRAGPTATRRPVGARRRAIHRWAALDVLRVPEGRVESESAQHH